MFVIERPSYCSPTLARMLIGWRLEWLADPSRCGRMSGWAWCAWAWGIHWTSFQVAAKRG